MFVHREPLIAISPRVNLAHIKTPRRRILNVKRANTRLYFLSVNRSKQAYLGIQRGKALSGLVKDDRVAKKSV